MVPDAGGDGFELGTDGVGGGFTECGGLIRGDEGEEDVREVRGELGGGAGVEAAAVVGGIRVALPDGGALDRARS